VGGREHYDHLSWSLIFSSTATGSATNIEATIDNPFAFNDAAKAQGGLVNNPSSQAPQVIVLLSGASSNRFLL
jgi:hypothetical protein